jgi:hypothetical protein
MHGREATGSQSMLLNKYWNVAGTGLEVFLFFLRRITGSKDIGDSKSAILMDIAL